MRQVRVYRHQRVTHWTLDRRPTTQPRRTGFEAKIEGVVAGMTVALGCGIAVAPTFCESSRSNAVESGFGNAGLAAQSQRRGRCAAGARETSNRGSAGLPCIAASGR
jgi:hypothetical protein